jgi:ferredoxin
MTNLPYDEVTITVIDTDGAAHTLRAPIGAKLRLILLGAGLSPYGKISERLNCGGRGLCATCGVWFEGRQPAPTHWHDRIGASFGWPRLTCQIGAAEGMTIRLVRNKLIWGLPRWSRRYRPE